MIFGLKVLLTYSVIFAFPNQEKLDHYLKVQIESRTKESFVLKQTTSGSVSKRTITHLIDNKSISEVEVPTQFFTTMLKEGKNFANLLPPQGDCGHGGISLIEIKSLSERNLKASKKTFCSPLKNKQKEWKLMQNWFSTLSSYARGQVRR
ncbi:MAG: hypothetical protein RJB66_1014 [Pseudomonadota bacterium]|jgi:hypothetical protein